jgi:hypothetical protein
MATLPMLLLNGDTATGPTDWGQVALDYAFVQDIASSTNNGSVSPDPGVGAGTRDHAWRINNMPADFVSMTTLLWRIRYGANNIDDQVSLQLRVVSRTSGTILAAADAGGTFQVVETWTSGFIFKNVGPTGFTYVNTGASKAQWDDAEVEFREVYTLDMSDDEGHVAVDAFELSGTYVASAPVAGLGARPIVGVS